MYVFPSAAFDCDDCDIRSSSQNLVILLLTIKPLNHCVWPSFSQQAGEGPIAVILSPTRELCEQIWREVTILTKYMHSPYLNLYAVFFQLTVIIDIVKLQYFRQKGLAKYIT